MRTRVGRPYQDRGCRLEKKGVEVVRSCSFPDIGLKRGMKHAEEPTTDNAPWQVKPGKIWLSLGEAASANRPRQRRVEERQRFAGPAADAGDHHANKQRRAERERKTDGAAEELGEVGTVGQRRLS